MEITMKRTLLGAVLILGAMLNAASADTQVFRDIQRPHGQDRGMAAKRADGRKCGSADGVWFSDVDSFDRCMLARGWVVDRIIHDRATAGRHDNNQSPPVDTSAPSNNDDFARVQNEINTQQMMQQQMQNNQ
jgi:hypothetical protein